MRYVLKNVEALRKTELLWSVAVQRLSGSLY
jgi:hypothetical protein